MKSVRALLAFSLLILFLVSLDLPSQFLLNKIDDQDSSEELKAAALEIGDGECRQQRHIRSSLFVYHKSILNIDFLVCLLLQIG